MEDRPKITVGYARVSTGGQISDNQIFEIQRYAAASSITVDKYVQETISSRKKLEKRALFKLLNEMQAGDTIIVSEISRLGRSLFEVMTLLGKLLERNIEVHAIKQNWWLGNNLISKVQAMGFTLSADLERDLISQRTKDGLARAVASGAVLGRKKGTLRAGVLDGKQEEIKAMLGNGVRKSAIARAMNVDAATVRNFIRRFGLDGSTPTWIVSTPPQTPASIKPNLTIKHLPLQIIEPAPILTLEAQPNKVWAYVRVSTDKQTNENQHLQIKGFAERKGWEVSEWCAETISSRKKLEERAVWEFINRIESGDALIISEISRLGRSQGEVLRIFELLLDKGVLVYSVRDNYCFSGDAASKTIVGCIAIAVQIERELISSRTVEALKLRKAQGITLGRPKGAPSRSCFLSDAYYRIATKQDFIKECLEKRYNLDMVCGLVGVADTCLERTTKLMWGTSYMERLKAKGGGFSKVEITIRERFAEIMQYAKDGVSVCDAAKKMDVCHYALRLKFKQIAGAPYHDFMPKGKDAWPQIMHCKRCNEAKPREEMAWGCTCKACNRKMQNEQNAKSRAKKKQINLPPYKDKAILSTALAFASVADVAKHFNTNSKAIRYWAKKFGL